MRLMWRIEFGRDRRPARGPKPKLHVEDIVTTAIEIADEEGVSYEVPDDYVRKFFSIRRP